MKELRFAIFGTGYWSRYQLAAWRELAGVRCVALYNRTRRKAQALGEEFGIRAIYDDPEALLRSEPVDFIDVITDVNSHARLVSLAAAHRRPVICQKPMAPDLETAEAMVASCREAGVPLFIHENWRWQTPVRALKAHLDSGVAGRVFRARIQYCNSFPVFDNQPFLKELDQFILTDMGVHILDTVRMLLGEAASIYCRTARVHSDIRGEDVATVMLTMVSGATATCEISYASRLEHERFPETYITVEGDRGSIELGPDCWIRVTTDQGTLSRRHPPAWHAWADPRYALSQSSGVACNAHLLGALRGEHPAETTGEDNLKTLRLVFGAYRSAATGQAVRVEA
ncbi:MAG TPA: Gfo/Idh/MocA family oxidoreductase [Candidatus Paceibacterota bacterium]|nr:Gfo/Idh/MocA family oxidoreductase [Verrucomicrobiota bacterium]HRZ43846.1 Gfo/Idh/MocA family oxidoreductase [Candidatus Paceibacterota bacterium]HRZ92569.1 Gfo/Idh/MocA family oxidoreductase [Candidatus Paceibacterota bacterium]